MPAERTGRDFFTCGKRNGKRARQTGMSLSGPRLLEAGHSVRLACVCLAVLWPSAVFCGQQTPPQEETVQFKSSVNVVMVPVTVRDGQGQAVEDLKKEDFQIFDRGKQQTISHFSVQKRAALASETRAAHDPTTESTETGHGVTVPSKARPERYVIFLFDDMHFEAGDLARVRAAASRMMAESLEPTDAAAVVTTRRRSTPALRETGRSWTMRWRSCT